MRLCLIGSGYVGLVSAACFAEMGHNVACVDINRERVDSLRQGVLPIYEPGLHELVARNSAEGRLTFDHDLAAGLDDALIVFICVGTPQDEDGACDLRQVESAARQIGRQMNKALIIAAKSTVPVGTSARIRAIVAEELAARGEDLEFDVVSNPEFLKEGSAVADFMRPDRVVVGASNPLVAELLRELYAPYVQDQDKMVVMSVESAELTKYAANAFLAAKISFINEIANMCEAMDADIAEVCVGIGTDERIGYQFLHPGVGYGGSCLPKDVSALIRMARDYGCSASILAAVDQVNKRQRRILAERVESFFMDKGGLAGRKIAVWGLSFKPDTDDMREAPSLGIIQYLAGKGARITAFDPGAAKTAAACLADVAGVEIVAEQYLACAGADALLLLTEWNQFRNPDYARMKGLMRHPVIFDGRNLYKPEQMDRQGFIHFGIGRKSHA